LDERNLNKNEVKDTIKEILSLQKQLQIHLDEYTKNTIDRLIQARIKLELHNYTESQQHQVRDRLADAGFMGPK